ncbi:MAG: hypothetical protein E7Z90_02265 [Cyanobacteria bacterium SIG29]|nr:hypothetical protein [Cyanobacteria bacterium SIG29]
MFFKKTILIDLDGVLNEYTGNYIEGFIPSIKIGAKEFLEDISKDYKIKIFTTREFNLVQNWIKENNLDEIISGVTNKKDLCWLYIDDRCICFNGNYNDLKNKINNFQPWYKL